MSLDVLFKLDPTSPASNSNYAGANIAENCAPSGLNNGLRALGSFVAQQLCYQSAALSASVSTNIATVPREAITSRIERGWSAEKAVSMPTRRTARARVVPQQGVYYGA